MRTMFAVGHQTGTHTRIVIAGRRQEDLRAAPARRESPMAPRVARRPDASVKTPAQGRVH